MADTSHTPEPIPGGSAVPVVALWFVLALAFGLVEGGYIRFASLVLHESTMLGPLVLWMAPTMDLIWFGFAAIGLVVIRSVWPEWVTLRVATGVLLFVGFLTLLFVFDRIDRRASVLLALGLAVQGSRLCAGAGQRFLRLIRRGIWAMPLLVAGIAGGQNLLARAAERRAIASLGTAQAGAPNVLLLVLDTVRDWDISADGYTVPTTPELEVFARGGVRFAKAWSASSWTLLSHESMFTGYFPHQLSGGLRTPFDGARTTLADALRDRGYVTGGFVANLHFCSHEFGLNRGFIHYEDYVVSAGELLLNSSLGRYIATKPKVRRLLGYYDIFGRKDAARLKQSLLDWTGENPEHPFFAFVNFYDAHEPYLPPADFEARFADPTPRKLYNTDESIRGARMLFKQKFTDAEVRRERQAYDASIAYTDAQIGQLLDGLRAQGKLDNTLVIVTADHGEQFADRGLFAHGNSLYEPLMNVPLMMALPGRLPAGLVVNDRVSLRDLPATVLELAGQPAGGGFPGQSLARFWAPDAAGRAADPLFFEVVTQKNEILRSLVVGDSQYVRHAGGTEELHILRRNENTPDVASDTSYAALILRLRRQVDSVLAHTGPDQWGR